MKISLVVLSAGKMQGKEIPIPGAEFKIGRDATCQLKAASPGIAEKHCAFLVRAGKVFLKDFGSPEGTLLNNAKISGEVEIKSADQIKVGPLHFSLKVVADPVVAAKSVPEPAPAPVVEKAKIAAPAPEKTSSDDAEPDLDDLLFDEGEKKDGPKPSWKDNIGKEPVQEQSATPASGGETPSDAKPSDKPQPTGDTSSAASALLAMYRPKKK